MGDDMTETRKSGIINDQIWGLDDNPSPIRIDGDLSMGLDQTLQIVPGTEVMVEDGFTITATDGSIIASGERGKPVVFRGLNRVRGGWVGIVSAGSNKLVMDHVQVMDATKGIDFNAGYGTLKDMKFYRCDYGLYLQGASIVDDTILESAWFEDNKVGVFVDSASPSTTGQYIDDCRFVRNKVGIELADGVGEFNGHGHRLWGNDIGVLLSGSPTTPDLTSIWHGSDSGPYHASLNPTGTGDELSEAAGTPDIDPWTQLLRYVPKVEDVRKAASRLLGAYSGGDAQKADVLTDEEIEDVIDRCEAIVDSWYLEGRPLSKRLFAYATETDEMHDVSTDEREFLTDFWPIVSVTSVSKRTGDSTWTAMTEKEFTGYYCSSEMKKSGRVRVNSSFLYDLNSIKITYVHGQYDAPKHIQNAVIKMAVLDIYQSLLMFGEKDVFSERAVRLQAEIEELKKEAMIGRKPWMVV